MTSVQRRMLRKLGYPEHILGDEEDFGPFSFRRCDPSVTVLTLLMEYMERGEDPTKLLRLSPDQDLFRLPTEGIEFMGCNPRIIPHFIRMDDGWMVVKAKKYDAWFSWENGISEEDEGSIILPPRPEYLRKLAKKTAKIDTELADKYRRLADWIERIPLVPVVQPAATSPSSR